MQHWAPDSPDGGSDENCAAMTVGGDDAANGFWTDISCTSDNVRAICEKDSSSTPTQGWRHGQIVKSTGSLSHLRPMLPTTISQPLPAQRPNHATYSLFDSKSQ